MAIEVDVTELYELADDLENVSANVGKYIRQAVTVSARHVKDKARDKVRSRRHFAKAASAIDYELKGVQGFGATVLDAEIGYNKDRIVGRLGNLIEYGAPGAQAHVLFRRRGKLMSAPVPGGRSRPLPPGRELQAALHDTEEDFLHGLEKAVDTAMREARI